MIKLNLKHFIMHSCNIYIYVYMLTIIHKYVFTQKKGDSFDR